MSVRVVELTLGERWIMVVRASKENEVLWRARDFTVAALEEIVADPKRAVEVLEQVRRMADFSGNDGYGVGRRPIPSKP